MNEIRYKQPTGHNCALHAISNLFGEDSIMKPDRLEYGIYGHTINDLNIYLKEDCKTYYIETLYKSIFHTELPEAAYVWPTSNIDTIPLLLAVVSNSGVNHIVGLKVTSDKTVYLYDSLFDNVVVTEFSKLHDIYPKIFALYAFRDNDPTNEGYISFIQ